MAFKRLIKKMKRAHSRAHWCMWILNNNGIFYYGHFNSYHEAAHRFTDLKAYGWANELCNYTWYADTIKYHPTNYDWYVTSFIPTKESFK